MENNNVYENVVLHQWNSNNRHIKELAFVYPKEKGVVVEFVRAIHVSTNQGVGMALSELYVKRFALTDSQLERLSFNKDNITNALKIRYEQNPSVVDRISLNASAKSSVAILLPVKTAKKVGGSFGLQVAYIAQEAKLPLIVRINGQDKSALFEGFETFEDKVVDNAYVAIFGKADTLGLQCELFENEEIKAISKSILAKENEAVGTAEKDRSL